MPRQTDTLPPALSHVVVAGGTPVEWHTMTPSQWLARVEAVASAASAEGASWVTLLPHHGDDLSDDELSTFNDMMLTLPGMRIVDVSHGKRLVWTKSDSLFVLIDPEADGHKRFANTIEGLRLSGVSPDDVSEEMLSQAVLAPATDEPDLVVVLGPADRIPNSMVWELAYSELVFLNLEWSNFESTHLELAIDDFNRRHRRFGGLDS